MDPVKLTWNHVIEVIGKRDSLLLTMVKEVTRIHQTSSCQLVTLAPLHKSRSMVLLAAQRD
jgi:hypothetical protein